MFREGRHVEKSKRRCEKTHRFFHWFFTKNRRKIVQKAWKQALCTKIDKKSRLDRLSLAKNRLLANFWGPPGSPGASQDVPGTSQNRSWFSFMMNCAWKRRWTASGRPQEGPGGPPRRPQGTILRRFLDLFCTSKTNENIQKVSKITQKILKNSWLWLGRPWTLDR